LADTLKRGLNLLKPEKIVKATILLNKRGALDTQTFGEQVLMKLKTVLTLLKPGMMPQKKWQKGLFLLLMIIGGLQTFLPSTVEAIGPQTPPADVEERSEAFNAYKLRPGTPLFVLLQTPVDTNVNQVGDPIEGSIPQDLYLSNQLIISKNARVKGLISRLDKPIQGRNAIMALRFTEITLANGDKIPIQAYVKTERPDHTWGGELTPGTKPYAVMHRVEGIGEYNKIVMGGPRAMGAQISFPPGERLTIILESPLAIVLPKF
jgi:hypothetical protein